MTIQQTKQPSLQIRLGILATAAMLLGTPAAAQIREAAADTNRVVWGWKDFSRYTPYACDQGIRSVLSYNRRAIVTDPVTGILMPDSLFRMGDDLKRDIPAPVRAVARSCAERFTVDGVDPRELLSLARIALLSGNPEKARAAFERRLAVDTIPSQIPDLLRQMIMWSMDMPPVGPEFGLMDEYMKRLKAVTPEPKIHIASMYEYIMEYWERQQHNSDSVRAHAKRLIAYYKTFTPEELSQVAPHRPFFSLMRVVNEAADVEEQQKLTDEIFEMASEWKGGRGLGNFSMRMEGLKALLGKKMQPLNGTWINHNNIPRPTPGRVTLIKLAQPEMETDAYGEYVVMRQIKERYGDKVDIVLITYTRGNRPGTGPLTTAEEAAWMGNYFNNYLKLPVSIVVSETPMTLREDGHYIRGLSELWEEWQRLLETPMLVLDKDAKVRWAGGALTLDFAWKRATGSPILNKLVAEMEKTP